MVPTNDGATYKPRNIVSGVTKGITKAVKKTTDKFQKQVKKQTSYVKDTLIVKSAPQLKDRGLQRPSINKAESFSFQNKKQKAFQYTGGQFLGVGNQVKDIVEKQKEKDAEINRPKSIIDYARYAAKRDTALTRHERDFNNKNALNQKTHDDIIKWGQNIMTDRQSMNDWILSATTPDEMRSRVETVNKYFENSLKRVPVFTAETNSVSEKEQFSLDSELPPWITPSNENLNRWDYYKTYAHDVVQAEVDSYNKYKQEQKELEKNPYKSAFSTSEEPGAINSFLDVIVASHGKGVDEWDKNLSTYWNEYVVNPVKHGKLLTAGGNAIWNMMETMDIAARGVRAFAAGDTALGGAGGREFEKSDWLNHGAFSRNPDASFTGQNVYWAKLEGHSDEEIQRAQRIFMDNGGYSLLLSAHPDRASRRQLGSGMANLSKEEREKIEAELDNRFKGTGIEWRDIYKDIDENYFGISATDDLKQGAQNVKKAYTDVDAEFNADTGSLVGDIVVESVLDPGLLVGGISKGTVSSGVRSAADNAVYEGMKALVGNKETAETLTTNPEVVKAIKELVRQNEGKNIIFKDATKIKDDVDIFIRRIKRSNPDILFDDNAEQLFRDTVTSSLAKKNQSINSRILASTDRFAKTVDDRTLKAAYYMDKSIDAIDSAIIKASFITPWATVKGVKAGVKSVVSLPDIQNAMARRVIRKGEALKPLRDELTGEVNVLNFPAVLEKQKLGLSNESDIRNALQYVVDQYEHVNEQTTFIIGDFLKKKISDKEAIQAVDDLISGITGGKYHNVNEFRAYVDDLEVKYASDIKKAYDRMEHTVNRLNDAINRRSEDAVSGFLDRVRQAQSIDELKTLFREHYDNEYILALRDDVIDNAVQIDNLTVDQIDNILSDLSKNADSINHELVNKGIKAVSNISQRTFERTISFNTFDEILKGMGVDWEKILLMQELPGAHFSSFERYISDFMGMWASGDQTIVYTVQDALKFIDRLERRVHFKTLMDNRIISEASALEAHRLMGQFNQLRLAVKKLDVVSLKDAKVVTLLHLDRMVFFQKFRNSASITRMYDQFYTDVIEPFVKEFQGLTTDEVDLIDSAFFKDIDTLAKQKYGFDRTTQLIEEAKALAGLSDDKLNSFVDALATNFNFHNEDGLLVMDKRRLRKKIEATLRGQTGDSKLGMKNITDIFQTAGTDNPHRFLQPYEEAFQYTPIKNRFDRIVNKDVLDPTAYVEKQMLFAAMADPSMISEWNALARKGQAPIAFHINSTGLNSEINSVTSVSFRKWVPIEETDDPTELMKRLIDAFESEETTVLKRNLSDADLDSISEDVIRKLDMKDVSVDSIRKRYAEVYSGEGNFSDEQSLLEAACAYINDATIVKGEGDVLRSVAPTLLVHDLDGFNIQYFNNKVFSYSNTAGEDSKILDYVTRVAPSAKNNSCNTYYRLAEQAGDFAYTDEEFERITDLVSAYVEDINSFAQGYRFLDMRTYSDTLDRVVKMTELRQDAARTSDIEDRFLKAYEEAKGSERLAEYVNSVRSITDLAINPRSYAFTSSGLEDNATKAALEATGQTTVNVETRIIVDDVLSYFNLDTTDGFYVPIEDLRKMYDLASYVIRTRDRQVVAGTEEFLYSRKAEFDKVIQTCIDLANNSTWHSTQLAYLKDMKIPDSATESYLMARKLYNDHLIYWIDDDYLASFKTRGKDLDTMKSNLREEAVRLRYASKEKEYDPEYLLQEAKVFNAACDYVNNNRRRFFDELTGGGFDPNNTELMEQLSDEFSESLSNYWDGTRSEMSQMWEDFKRNQRNEWEQMGELWDSFRVERSDLKAEFQDVKQEFIDEFKQTRKDFELKYADVDDALIDAYNIDREYKSFLYEDIKEKTSKKWAEYRTKRDLNKAAYESAKAKSDGVWAVWREKKKQFIGPLNKERYALKQEALQECRNASQAIWDAYHKSKYDLDSIRKEIDSMWDEYMEAKKQADSYVRVKEFFKERKELPQYDTVQKYLNELDTMFKEDADRLYQLTKQKADALADNLKAEGDIRYRQMKDKSQLYYDQALEKYEQFIIERREEFYTNIDTVQDKYISLTDDTLALLDGAREPEIFNWAAQSDFEKTIVKQREGVLSEGLDKAAKYSEANSEVKSGIRQLEHTDAVYSAAGLERKADRLTASLYVKAKQLFDILDQTGFARRESFQKFMSKASEMQRLHLAQYRYNALKVDGEFNRNKLMSELLYNGFNMTVFNAHNYSVEEARELRQFVEGLQKGGDDFLSYYEDRTTGNIFIYLNTNATVSESGSMRYINQAEGFERPVHEAIPFADFDELKSLMDYDDIEDFRGVYEHLLSCWEDTRLLSIGQINGTTGRTVSRKQAEDFLATLPSNMNDWCTSEGLLRSDIARDVVYDPGFVINDPSDMLTDYLGTLKRQADIAKDDCIMIREMFTKDGDNLQFSELAENFSDEALMDYFGNNPDYVVCTLTRADNTKTGLQLRRLDMSKLGNVKAAKQMQNTTILPYSAYFEVANYMNADATDNIAKRFLGKYLQAYKAFALVKPGTWMRNYVDATMKAGLDNGEGLGGIAEMLQYEAMASKYLGKYSEIMATDPSLLNKSNWDIIQRAYNTDMTYEDFELIRGVADSKMFTTADKKYIDRTVKADGGFARISGENIGLRNLDETNFREAYKKYLEIEPDLPLSKKEFSDIYFGKVVPDEETNELYEDMFRKMSINMRNADASSYYDKAINTMFKPFGDVETLVRTAQTMMLRDQGFSQNQITRHIHATQFYTAPSWGAFHQLEAIMPFVTFKYNNIKYWMKMMDENPRFFRYFEEVYGNISEDTIEGMIAEGQEIDYENDYALQSGAIPIGSGKVYLNLNNSFMSAINDFYGFTNNIQDINPLFRDAVRGSLYAFGFGSKEFFSGTNLNVLDDDMKQKVINLVPGASLAQKGYKTFKNIYKQCTEDGGPTMDTLFSTLNFLSVLGIRKTYEHGGDFDFKEWQEELAADGQWYDCNLGKIVDISEKNTYGANDPNNSFEDVQNYMLVHFGKVWDPNQHKFVQFDDTVAGNLDVKFDFQNDPDAWEKLQKWMAVKGKRYDYNQRKFVTPKDYISGGLNDPNISFNKRVQLMEELFPNLKWDANQNTFVEADQYIAGGLNDFSQYEGRDFLQHWNELQSLRLALYGETYNRATRSFEKTQDPSVVLYTNYLGIDTHDDKDYDNYYAQLAIPRLWKTDGGLSVNSEGFLITQDGKYVLTGNATYDAKVFDRFRNTISFGGRQYYGFKNFSYNKTRKSDKPYHGRTLPKTYYTGFGWNESEGYYRWNYEYNYQYHNPQPSSQLNRLISPPKIYPYGGGYGKFSFYGR